MHRIQQELLQLSEKHALNEMKLREIGDLIGEKHPQKIKHHMTQLAKKGLLGNKTNLAKARQLETNALKSHTLLSIPILGAANCGEALSEAAERLEGYLNVSHRVVSGTKDLFALRAIGSSMDRADINGNSVEDGDYVIINPKLRSAKNGDYVLSVINGTANIKRFMLDKENSRVVLVSESSRDLPPMVIHLEDQPEYFVNGKVVAVIKKHVV